MPESGFDWDSWFDMLGDIDIDIGRDQQEQYREGIDDLFSCSSASSPKSLI